MYTTNDTFGQQIDEIVSKWKFTTSSGAYALFYWGKGASTGLRLEVGFLAKEFVDNVEWGHGASLVCPLAIISMFLMTYKFRSGGSHFLHEAGRL